MADRTPVDRDHEADSRPDLRPQLGQLRALEMLTALHDPDPVDLLIGAVLSHYRVVERLGAGVHVAGAGAGSAAATLPKSLGQRRGLVRELLCGRLERIDEIVRRIL